MFFCFTQNLISHFLFLNIYFVLGIISKRSVGIQNDSESHFDWFKDFMRQSLDTIRDTVLQACLTALSTRSISPLNTNIPTQDVNLNNHRNRLVQSQHSLTSHKKNDFLLLRNKLDGDDDIDGKPRIHHRARINPYPMYKNILRTPVSDIQVPWSYEWLQYKPTIFTADEVYINPGADPGINKFTNTYLFFLLICDF
jgi:hypothetical protein